MVLISCVLLQCSVIEVPLTKVDAGDNNGHSRKLKLNQIETLNQLPESTKLVNRFKSGRVNFCNLNFLLLWSGI